MKSISLGITNFCNEFCRHCFYPQKRNLKHLDDLNLLERMLGEFADLGFISLLITGGEPLTNPLFKEICLLARKRRYLISIKTNGTLLDVDTVEFLKNLKPKIVEISLYSADSTEHDFITNLNGSWEKSLKAVKTLKLAGVKVCVVFPVLRGIKHWRETPDLLKSFGVPFRTSCSLFSSFDCRSEVESFKGDVKSYFDFISFFNRYESQKIKNIDKRRLAVCSGAVELFAATPNFEIKPCISFPETVGKYEPGKGKTLLLAARKKLEERFAAVSALCRECESVKYCSSCPAKFKIVDGVAFCDQSKKDWVEAYKNFFESGESNGTKQN